MGLLNLVRHDAGVVVDLAGLHDLVCAAAEAMFPRPATLPMWFFFACAKGLFVVEPDTNCRAEEDMAVAMLRTTLKMLGATAYAVMAEARIRTLDNPPMKDGKPDLDAIDVDSLPFDDVLVVMTEDRAGTHVSTRWLVSGRPGRYFLGPRIDEGVGDPFGGRLQGWLK